MRIKGILFIFSLLALQGLAGQASGQQTDLKEILPNISSGKQIEKLHGKKVCVQGRYEVEPFPGGKMLQAVEIVLPDKTRLMRSYRPIPKEFGFIGKEVFVIGTVYANQIAQRCQ